MSLLTREGEVVIAKRIEAGEQEIQLEVGRSPVFLNYAIELSEALKEGVVRVRDLFADDDASAEGDSASESDDDASEDLEEVDEESAEANASAEEERDKEAVL